MSEQLIERAQDVTGLLRSIKNDVGDYARLLVDLVVTAVAKENQVTLDVDLQRQVVDQILREGPRLAPGQLQPHVLDVIGRVRRESATWAAPLDAFLKAQNLSPSPRERQRLLRRLNAKVLRPEDLGNAQARSVFFGEVLDEVRGERDGADDPITLVAAPRAIEPWDFRVNLFEESELQPVLPANILATGALTWCYDIGERMGLYPLTDALVLRWWTGQVDFADPTLISELYRYYKLSADQRPTKEDRGQLYHRILATGGTEVIGRATVNDSFPALWRSLMEEVTRYVTKEETAARDNRVNRRAIYQATRELQYNLTASMQGMALLQVTEMYKQLDQDPRSGQLGALQILGHPEVVDQLASGRRRSVWSVVERLAQEEFDLVPNVAALRTSASEGYRVFEWIAEFDDGTVDEARFTSFIDSATAWILSQEASESDLAAVVEEAPPDTEFDEDVPEFADSGAW